MVRALGRCASTRSIKSDSEGAALIELAAVLPILLLLFLGTVDLSRIIATKLDLEQAAQRTTDFALAHRPRGSDGTYLVAEATTASGMPAQNIAVEIFLECGDVRQTTFSAGCPPGVQRARFVSIEIVQQIEPVFDWAALATFLGFQLSPMIVISGDSVVRFQ